MFGKLSLTFLLYQRPPAWPWANHEGLNHRASRGTSLADTDPQHTGCSASWACISRLPHSKPWMHITAPPLSTCTTRYVYQISRSTKHQLERGVEKGCFYIQYWEHRDIAHDVLNFKFFLAQFEPLTFLKVFLITALSDILRLILFRLSFIQNN